MIENGWSSGTYGWQRQVAMLLLQCWQSGVSAGGSSLGSVASATALGCPALMQVLASGKFLYRFFTIPLQANLSKLRTW